MSRASTLILLGILTILVPFSGLPIAIRNLLAVIVGSCVLGIGVALRARDVQKMQQSAGTSSEPPAGPPAGVSPI